MLKPALVILVHGFNVWDGGRATVGKLRPFLSQLGVPYIVLNYGHVGLIRTRLKNRAIAKRLAASLRTALAAGQRPIVVGHSNGCAIIHLALAQMAWREQVEATYINPALRKDAAMAPSLKRLVVWHSPSDKPVRWSKWLPTSNARPWGEMGATGYTGNDSRVVNHNKESMAPPSASHSDVFSVELLPFYGPLIAGDVVGGGR